MRGSAILAMAAACLVAITSSGPAAGWQQADDGNSVAAEEGKVDLWAWIEAEVPGAAPADPAPGSPKQPCYFRQGNLAELDAWLGNDFVFAPDSFEVYVFKICETNTKPQLVAYWVHKPRRFQKPAPTTAAEITRLRNEAWGALSIPEPTILMAPGEVTIVQIPTYVWVSAADRAPVSETVTTTLEGHKLSLTATASPRRLGFLRVEMGDGNTLWCDADDVMAFDYSRDPMDQPSDCFHYYRYSSAASPDFRYEVLLTAYWDVEVQCIYDGGPCTNPPPAVPTQVLTAPSHRIAVAEIQALARPVQVV